MLAKTAVALRHVPFEDLGSFEERLARHGYAVEYRDAVTEPLRSPELEAADLLVVLGGPVGVYERGIYPFLQTEVEILRRRILAGHPTLGICLGCQLIAAALGARVYPGGKKEIGWAPLTLTEAGRASALQPLDAPVRVLHWHGDTFDLPDQAVLLASTPLFPHQAFSWGKGTLALQFHPEVVPSGLERWYVGHSAEISGTPGVSVPALRADAARHGERLAAAARDFLDGWLRGLAG